MQFSEYGQDLVLPTKTTTNKVQTNKGIDVGKVRVMEMYFQDNVKGDWKFMTKFQLTCFNFGHVIL